MLLRQERDEVPEETLSCPDRNKEVFHHYRHYEGLRLLPSVCEQIIIQQTLVSFLYHPRLTDGAICAFTFAFTSTLIGSSVFGLAVMDSFRLVPQ